LRYFAIIQILLFYFGIAFSQTPTQFKKQLNNTIEGIREGKEQGNVYAFDSYIKSIPETVIDESSEFLHDTTVSVRRFTSGLIRAAGIGTSDILLRQKAVLHLTDLCGDAVPEIRSEAGAYLRQFRKNDFHNEAKEKLSAVLRFEPGYCKPIVQIAGYLDLNEEIPQLKGMLSDTTVRDPEFRWKIHTALARLGDEESIDYCMGYAKSRDVNDLLVKYVFADLAYIKQREAIDYLISELNSDEANCRPGNPELKGKITCAYRIMELLAPCISDFPFGIKHGNQLDVPDYEAALKEVRVWFREHPGYEINREVY
jgi:hypothetical protein